MSPVIRRKKKTFSISGKHLLMVLSGLCAALMIFTFQTSVFEGSLKQAAGYVVIPFQEGIASVGGYLTAQSDRMQKMPK